MAGPGLGTSRGARLGSKVRGDGDDRLVSPPAPAATPGLAEAMRQPGTVACAAASAVLLAGGLFVLSRYASMANPIGSDRMNVLVHMPNDLAWGSHDWPVLESRIPPAVVSAWVTLALCGRWRAESSWIDRTGRVFGSFWVGLWMFRWYLVLGS